MNKSTTLSARELRAVLSAGALLSFTLGVSLTFALMRWNGNL